MKSIPDFQRIAVSFEKWYSVSKIGGSLANEIYFAVFCYSCRRPGSALYLQVD